MSTIKLTPKVATVPMQMALQLQQATSLPEISNVFLQVFERLQDNTELHINFIIQTTHSGNNVNGYDVRYNAVKGGVV